MLSVKGHPISIHLGKRPGDKPLIHVIIVPVDRQALAR
jgi:hypothetical protein